MTLTKIERSTPDYWRASAALFLSAFSVFAAIYSVQPLLPVFATEFGLDAATSSVSLSTTTAMLALSLVLIGWLGNRFNRKRLMLTTMLAMAVLMLAVPMSGNWTTLVGVRALLGIAVCGVPAIAMVYLAEMIGWRAALTALGALILVNALLFLLLPPARMPRAQTLNLRQLGGNFATVFADKALPLLFLCSFLMMGGFVVIYNYVGFRLLAPPYNLDQGQIALVFMVYLVGTFGSAWIGALAGRLGRRKLFWPLIVVMMAGPAITLMSALWAIVLGMAIVTFAFFGRTRSPAPGWHAAPRMHGRRAAPSICWPTMPDQASSERWVVMAGGIGAGPVWSDLRRWHSPSRWRWPAGSMCCRHW
ncbi:MAG: MFS transporter [Candidatus Devosia euplotis]|nr:MFS transporter [Candidatus Devosia euplotis]